MSDTSRDILDLLPEPHRTLAKQRRADAAREAQTPNSSVPRHLRIALASATRAFQSGDLSTLGTANEDLQPLIDAAIAWGRRQGKDAPDLLFAPDEGVNLEEVLRLDREATPGPWEVEMRYVRRIWDPNTTVDVPAGIIAREVEHVIVEYDFDGAEDNAALITTYRAAAPALAREVQRLRAEAADMQRAHAETLDYLFEQRDSLSKRVLNLEESREAAWADALRMAEDGDRLHVELTQERARADALTKRVLVLEELCAAWRRAANVAPVTQCGACGAALLPQPRDNGFYPCACGSVERVTTFATPSTALDVVRLKAELDTETRRHEAATTRLSTIHDVLLSSTGSSPAITDPPNVWRRFIDDLADLADDGKALPLFQRLVERTAAALGLDKEQMDPETGELFLPSWHDIPERVSKLREENANLLSKKEGT